jgi:hypothetical protein
MPRSRAFSTGLLAASLLGVSCGGVQKVTGMLKDVLVVQEQLAKVLVPNEIRVNLMNGAFLNIEVVNSPLRDLPAEQKKAKRSRSPGWPSMRTYPGSS